jgi:Tol biopolymer transport system component
MRGRTFTCDGFRGWIVKKNEERTSWPETVGRTVWIFAVVFSLLIPCGNAVWAAGHERIVFVRDGNIWSANVDGTAEKKLTTSGQDGAPAFSPDQQWIAFHSGRDEQSGFGQIYLMPATGGTTKKFSIYGIQGAEFPFFGPRGTSLVFIATSPQTTPGTRELSLLYATISVSVIDLNSFRVRTIVSFPDVLLDAGDSYSWPSFSPDGSLVAFQHNWNDLSGGFEIVDLAGKTVGRFPKQGQNPYWKPRFSPDGTQILCYAPPGCDSGSDMVYLVNVAKGSRKRITEGANPTFVKNGKAIVFERCGGRCGEGVKSDLWYLDLSQGATPRKIIANGSQPSGSQFVRQWQVRE